MGTVFISYSYKDKSFVDWLVERLTKQNISVWYDKYEILLGDSISKKLEEGIKSSSFIIIILSKSSIKSLSEKRLPAVTFTIGSMQNRNGYSDIIDLL